MFLNSEYRDVTDKYASVIECDIKNCRVNNYSFDENYRYLQVRVNLRLVCCEKGKIITRNEPVELRLYRNRKSAPENSMVSYTCEKCGSSVSILNGGVCEHCNSRIDFSKYDWAISEYKSGWDTNP